MNGTQQTKNILNVAVAMWSHADIIQMTNAVFFIMAEVNVLGLNKQNNWNTLSPLYLILTDELC
jgi:hypothetical protein